MFAITTVANLAINNTPGTGLPHSDPHKFRDALYRRPNAGSQFRCARFDFTSLLLVFGANLTRRRRAQKGKKGQSWLI